MLARRERRPDSHPPADSDVSRAPIRFGDHVAELGRVPATETRRALSEWRLGPHRDAHSPDRARDFDEAMTVRPADSLAAHRPLGSVSGRGCGSTRP